MRRSAAILAISLVSLGCNRPARVSQDTQGASASTSAAVMAAGALAAPVNPTPVWDKVDIAFTADERHAFFTAKDVTVRVDLRAPRGAGTVVRGRYDRSGARTLYGLSWENNEVFQEVETFDGGRRALRTNGDERFLDDLDTGATERAPTEITDAFRVVVDATGTSVRPFAGPERRFPHALAMQGGLLVGDGKDEDHTVVVDPESGRTITLPFARRDVTIKAAGADHALAVRRLEGDLRDVPSSEVAVVELATGRIAARVPRLGTYELRPVVAADGSTVAWAERASRGGDEDAEATCRVAIVALRTGRTVRTAPRPCPSSVALPDAVDAREVAVLEGDTVTTYDATTGALRRQRRAARVAAGAPTPIHLGLFAKELAAARKEQGTFYDVVSPLLRDRNLYEAKHGYEVIAMGDGATMLVKRGKEIALCDMQTGASCRALFETSESVEAVFSPTGKTLALVTPGGGRVYDVTTGRLRWSSASLPPA